MTVLQRPTGTCDILPEEIPSWRRLESLARQVFERAGFREVRTPMFESTDLFVRGIGQVTDIVEKEMYTIPARGEAEEGEGGSLSLRPENTAPIVRAYLEHGLIKSAPFQKLWYFGPQFRYERKQAFRQRQFYQVGAEILGTKEALADVELVNTAMSYLTTCGIPAGNLHLRVNSIGCNDPACRPAYRTRLREYFGARKSELCGNCQRRLERNVLRILDCKVEGCRKVAAEGPVGLEFLCASCTEHFAVLRAGLDASGLTYQVDPLIVRGLDYYVRTVFEVSAKGLGAQDAIGAGGRYDGLIPELGGDDVGAVGFALGAERILGSLAAVGTGPSGWEAEKPEPPVLFLILAERGQAAAAVALIAALRRLGLACEMDLEARSFRAQMRAANKLGARYVLIVGKDLSERGVVTLKWMLEENRQEDRPVVWDGSLFAAEWIAQLAQELRA